MGLNQNWVVALKEDFPDYLDVIDQSKINFEPHLDLIEDYYFCKQRIRLLRDSEESSLLKEFIIVFEDLKDEIQKVLSNQSSYLND